MKNKRRNWETPRILHIAKYEKFIDSLLDVVEEHFEEKRHRCFVIGKPNPIYSIKARRVTTFIRRNFDLLAVLKLFYAIAIADRVFIHGLWHNPVKLIIIFWPKAATKFYWAMWGGDFYFPEKQNFLTRACIKRIRNFITYVPQDFDYVRNEYGANGKRHCCLMYPSNAVKNVSKVSKNTEKIRVLVGNSAVATNEHADIFHRIASLKSDQLEILCPLSYGDPEYAKTIAEIGRSLFGNSFQPLFSFMPPDKYNELLATIDVAFFAHRRQQGMGNAITLLQTGSKVYMRSDVSQWQLFTDIGIRLYDLESDIEIAPLDEKTKAQNSLIIQKHFSESTYLSQLKDIFEFSKSARTKEYPEKYSDTDQIEKDRAQMT